VKPKPFHIVINHEFLIIMPKEDKFSSEQVMRIKINFNLANILASLTIMQDLGKGLGDTHLPIFLNQ